jgi:cytoskeletal protein CcmA (bactofilin family)
VVSLANGADVTGNIYCRRIVMQNGARFAGKIDMGEPQKIVVPKKTLQVEAREIEKVSA